ncbi:hypothetical protein RhiirA4_492856 [Rhizophagus irregularis]|uniref:Uncharacterized protein n=1 Tax=Rhizophagus irregularis TaxID=588596 RepID=A0A2I1HXC5_9GLOM|nr:hypothetical protein RhiirA4_492856 [Rhizophagus irregularis]
MARISWVVLLVFAVLLYDSQKHTNPFRGTNQSQLLRKRITTAKGKRSVTIIHFQIIIEEV